MAITDAMRERHSIRRFEDKPLDEGAVKILQEEIDTVNNEGGFHIQLAQNEPEAFQGNMTSYGNFECCKNYLVIAGPKCRDTDAGYYGERVVLKAKELGIDSCWVAMTYDKSKAKFELLDGEKRYIVVALGYGNYQGVAHKSKSIDSVSDYKDGDPDWYKEGIEAALLAPTAINQQKFKFEKKGDKVKLKVSGIGPCTKIDLGIVKYHFEVGSGCGKEVWA